MSGTIIHIFSKPEEAYEIEFIDDNGKTIQEFVVFPHQIEKI